MIRWWMYVIMVQILLWTIAFFWLYHNYEALTKSSSIKEHYNQTFSLSSRISKNHNSANSLWSGILMSWAQIPQTYSWIFGIVEQGKRDIWWIYNTIAYKRIQINIETHDSILYVVSALQNKIIDTTIARYLISLNNDRTILEQTINDLNFLSKYTKTLIITKPEKDLREKLNILISENDLTNLINYLKNLEEKIQNIHNDTNINKRSNKLLSSNQFAYVYNQIHVDENNRYRKNIKLAAEIFNLNQNIIKACIVVEQLRAFYTFKWLFKSVSQSNKYLTVMSKQSFGIGGMKLATAENLEKRLQYYKPELYQKYFAYPEGSNIHQQRMARLTDSKEYYYQVLYTAGVLYQYSTDRSKAGYEIKNQPWIIATMYNIGYSDPHPNADIGWSFMKIEWDTYSFGGLAMLVYYYLEIFG